jgi:DNA-directed RNA polymerase specialized sigma24 family protein
MPDLDPHLPRIAAGDAGAFGRWLAGAEHELRASLRGFAAQVDTEAVLQEALLRVWQVAPRVKPDGRPNALLRMAVRVARNLAVDEARRAGFRAPLGEEDLAALLDALAGDAAPDAPDPLLRRLIARCREKLAAKPRAALDARLQAGGAAPDATLAARLGMRLNTFLQNVGRARKALADCLRRGGVALPEHVP